MDKLEYLKLIEKRFRHNFPNSHLMIDYQLSSSKALGVEEEWSFCILNHELQDEDLPTERVQEAYNNFKEFDHRVNWHMYRMSHATKGINNEIKAG